MRSSGGTNFGLVRSVVACTKSRIACLAGPSFQDGSGSICANAGSAAERKAGRDERQRTPPIPLRLRVALIFCIRSLRCTQERPRRLLRGRDGRCPNCPSWAWNHFFHLGFHEHSSLKRRGACIGRIFDCRLRQCPRARAARERSARTHARRNRFMHPGPLSEVVHEHVVALLRDLARGRRSVAAVGDIILRGPSSPGWYPRRDRR